MDPYKLRELVFLLLFSFEMDSDEKEELIELLKIECKVSRAYAEAAFSRAQTVVRSLKEIDALLEKVSHSYSIDRLQSVERNILRLGIFELVIEKEVPPKVVLSEAKRLAKKFSTDDAGGFVQTLLVSVCELSSIEIGTTNV